jgi:hypothetical protein
MGTPSAGDVVLMPFPYSDLSKSKRRPALVVLSAQESFTANEILILGIAGQLISSKLAEVISHSVSPQAHLHQAQ